jgi:hypothetical protein
MMDAQTIVQGIRKAVETFRDSPGLADNEAYRALVTDGVDAHLAARLVEFLPIAYCRLILENSGVKFSEVFHRARPVGIAEHSFASEPVWSVAVKFARAEIRDGTSGERRLAVAGRSAEFRAANKLLNQGSDLHDIVLSPPLLNWPESGPDA